MGTGVNIHAWNKRDREWAEFMAGSISWQQEPVQDTTGKQRVIQINDTADGFGRLPIEVKNAWLVG